MKRVIPCLVSIPLVAALFCTGCNRPAAEAAVPSLSEGGTVGPLKVTTVQPARKPLVRRTEQPGQIEPYEVTPLHAKVSGYVRRLHVDIGDEVRGPQWDEHGNLVEPGQVLVELDVPELLNERVEREAAVELAQAELEQAQAAVKVAEAKVGSAEATINESRALVAGAEATLAKYKAELDRITQLAESGTVTRKLADETTSQFQAAEAQRTGAEAAVVSAEAARTQAEADVEKARADVKAAEARLQVSEAELEGVLTMLEYMTIRAPFDGVVTERNVHTGHLISSGAAASGLPMLVVARTDRLRISMEVPEVDAVHVQRENEVKLRIPSLPGETLTLPIARTQWTLNQGSRTLRCEIDFDNRESRLRPGMYAYADIKVAERAEALVLPRSAILTQDNQAFCYVVDANRKIVKVPITIGLRSGAEVEVLSGLQGDEMVIGANVTSLREGQIVEPAPAA